MPVDQTWIDQILPWLTVCTPDGLTILPLRVSDGLGVFSAETASSVKLLRANKYDVQLLATPSRTYASDYSADPEVVLAVVLNLASNAAWDAMKALVQLVIVRIREVSGARTPHRLRLVIGGMTISLPDGRAISWRSISGAPDDVVRLVQTVTAPILFKGPPAGPTVDGTATEEGHRESI
jgi:hypothetical protein